MEKTRRRLMIEDMQLRGLSPHTQAAYLMRVTLFARFCNKHPDHLGEKEIREYLLHLVNEQRKPWKNSRARPNRKALDGSWNFSDRATRFWENSFSPRQTRCGRPPKSMTQRARHSSMGTKASPVKGFFG